MLPDGVPVMIVIKSRWRNRWHVYEVDVGGRVWLASFASELSAKEWVRSGYQNETL